MKSIADIYAIALIAASKALHVDPIAALTVKGHEARRALYPAAFAIQCRLKPRPSESSLARSFGFSRSGYKSWATGAWTSWDADPAYAAMTAIRQALLEAL